MRIARWRHLGEVGEGFVVADPSGGDGTAAVDVVVPFPHGLTVADVLASGLADLPALAAEAGIGTDAVPRDASVALDDVELLAPLVPASVRDFVAFEEHVEGVTAAIDGASRVPPEWYELPTFYFTNPHSIVATRTIVRPPMTERLDFELEVGAVIGAVRGSEGRDLTPADAARHVFGYTIFNDWSARDVQGREMQVRLGPAKGKDFATTLGPWIVTADEFTDLEDDEGFLHIAMEVLVDGVLIGQDLLSNMGWPFAELVAYASRDSRVVPGDVLGSGTAGNGGCLAELWGRAGDLVPPPLRHGNEVVMRVERIGEIRSTVGRPVDVPPIPPARPRSRARSRG